MLHFFVGLWTGGTVGFFTAALLAAAKSESGDIHDCD